jgi:hypothetical protein
MTGSRCATALVVSLWLAACGGGGGGNNDPAPLPVPVAPAPGIVGDGP